MIQHILPITIDEITYNIFDFIVTHSNVEAYKAITSNTPFNHSRLLIIGDKGSGKTHLTAIWKHLRNAIYIHSLDEYYSNANNYNNIIIDNIESIDEYDLFSLINSSTEDKKQLLMTCSDYNMISLNDLKSRLHATYKILIKDPDEYLIQIILRKSLNDKQIKVENNLVSYVAEHIRRDFRSLQDFITSLNYLIMHEKNTPPLKLAKKLLEMNEKPIQG